MTINVTITRDKGENPARQAVVSTVDLNADGEVVGQTDVAMLEPGEGVTVGIFDGRKIEVREL